MNRAWKSYRILLTAGAMAVCMAAGLGMGIQWSRDNAQKAVVEAAEKKFINETGNPAPYEPQGDLTNLYGERLYKDVVDEDIGKEVCDKYKLDYDKVLESDLTREMRNYEESLWLRKKMGDCPLLGRELDTHDGFSSLEEYISDIYAFGEGEEVIRTMCEEFEIDPDQAKVSDLTTEQLIETGEKAYETSDHPKG